MLGCHKECRGAKPIRRGLMKLTTCEGKSTAHLRTRFITVRHFAIRANNPDPLWPRGHATYYRGPMLALATTVATRQALRKMPPRVQPPVQQPAEARRPTV